MTVAIRVCVDVPDLEAAVAFYTAAFELRVGRRFDRYWAELLGAACPIDLLASHGEGAAVPNTEIRRDFARHWTPVHLDFMVTDLDASVARAVAHGAVVERPARVERYGRIANLADPFGHGVCLVELNERGYDALVSR